MIETVACGNLSLLFSSEFVLLSRIDDSSRIVFLIDSNVILRYVVMLFYVVSVLLPFSDGS